MWRWRQFWGRLLRSENGVDDALIRAGVPVGAGLDELPVMPTLRQERREGAHGVYWTTGSIQITTTPGEVGVMTFTTRADQGKAEGGVHRSEEHTSELQSRQYLVCRLLLEKKKKNEDNPDVRHRTRDNNTTITHAEQP